MSEPIAFNYYRKAQSNFKPPLIANENAYLGDVFTRYLPLPFCHPNPVTCPASLLKPGSNS